MATELQVFGFINHTHPAASDPAEDAVMGNRLTHGLRGRGHWSGHVRWGRRGRSTPSSLVCCTLSQRRLMPYCLTGAVLILDIETEWTLNASLTTSSSYRRCSKRRTLDH
jgi:hypothetical protein